MGALRPHRIASPAVFFIISYKKSCVSKWNLHGKSYIAEKLKVHESTIRREIKNNCDKRSGEYNPELAQRKSEARMSSRNHFTKMDDAMTEKINLLLYEGWSPEQIHGRLKYEGVDIVSHETIYKYVYEDKRLKGNGKGLYKHLRRKGRKYAKRGNQYKGRGIIVDRVDIDQRPNIVNENIRFDDLEGDTIIGKNRKGAIETIIDRHTCFLWMSKLSEKEGRTKRLKLFYILLINVAHVCFSILISLFIWSEWTWNMDIMLFGFLNIPAMIGEIIFFLRIAY